MGDRAGVLRLYQTLERILDQELGVAPSPEAKTLAGGSPTGNTGRAVPLPPTPLVGRASEMAEVQALLARPDCRLLNLVGLCCALAHGWWLAARVALV